MPIYENDEKIRKVEKVAIPIVTFLLSFGLCFVFFKFHLITDTYWNFSEGFDGFSKIALADGRVLSSLILKLMAIINVPMKSYIVIQHIVSTIIYASIVIILYFYINKLTMRTNKVIGKIVILLGSFLIVFNPLTVENYAYTDNITMAIAFILYVGAAILINEDHYWISKGLLLLGTLSYQGNIIYFVFFSVFFFLRNNNLIPEFRDFSIKERIYRCIKGLVILAWDCIEAIVINYFIIKFANKITGIDANRFSSKIPTLDEVLRYLEIPTSNFDVFTFKFYSAKIIKYVIAFTGILLVLESIYIRKPKNVISNIIYYIIMVALGIYICLIPSILTGKNTLSARTCGTIGALIGFSIIYLYLCLNDDYWISSILLIATSIILIISVYNEYWSVAKTNVETNEKDREYGEQIVKVIKEYEVYYNIEIKNISIFKDSKSVRTYGFADNTFTCKGIAPNYSDTPFVEYFLGRKLNEVEIPQNVYDDYFDGKEWNEFAINQMLFDGDTLYLCVY